MGEVSDLIAAASSPADLAVVLVAGTAGLVVDATVTAFGFPSPAIAAFTFAGGALGLKKSGDAFWAARRARRDRVLSPQERGERLMSLWIGALGEGPQSVVSHEAIDRLATNLFLHREGIISDDALGVELDEALTEYRLQGSPGMHIEIRSTQPERMLE